MYSDPNSLHILQNCVIYESVYMTGLDAYLLRTKVHCKHIALCYIRVYPKLSGLAAWSENCKWYGSLPIAAVVSLFCESV
jgi:hypothetical protein